MQNLREDVLRFRGAERPLAGQHLVEHDAQAPDIAASVQPVGFATDLFRRHVFGCPGPVSAQSGERAAMQCQAKIGDVRVALFIQQHVARFQVAMDEPFAMGGLQCFGNLQSQFGGLRWIEGSVLFKVSPQVAALDVLLHQNDTILFAKHVKNRDDARMVQLGGSARLGHELLQVARGGESSFAGQFHGDKAIQFTVPRQANDAKRTAAKCSTDLISPDLPRQDRCTGRTLHKIDPFHAGTQLFSQVGMRGQDRFLVRVRRRPARSAR